MNSPLWDNIFKNKKSTKALEFEAIKNANIFDGLKNKELKFVQTMVYLRKFKKGEYIFKKSNPGNGMYIILKGEVQIIDENKKEQKQNLLATLVDGEFFGELSLLDESPRSASALCSDYTEALGFFRSDLLDITNRKPLIGSKIVLNVARILGERLRVTNNKLYEIQHKDK
ncbi:MAG: cyclic nucleotide-binding domain-containing protein [Candidatus Marinimicrobia bacterium]|jgi:CRP/FNR family cyclic AMP-dependent transcriptional regulator|nr:cyclic nucleotide-binding domain-containing protein [Candidatus Neomarinimicrobiota bacterium]